MNLKPENQLSLYGHHVIFLNFINLYKNNKLPNKILLSGEKGIGKSTLAYHIINQIYLRMKIFHMILKISELTQIIGLSN